MEICKEETCTGCLACYNICPKRAIIISTDAEGFDRPVIDNDLCIECGLCQKVCPVNHVPDKLHPIQVYSGWSNDEAIRLDSSSGGAFSEIANLVLKEDGVVFGCAMNEQLCAEHVYIENVKDLSKLRGSKYTQSKIGLSFQKAKSFLQKGRLVLFTGTPCQIAGLKNYLRRDYENLITVDIICHGVPSPMIFHDYLNFMSKKFGMNITDVKFRSKKYSWIFFNMTLKGQIKEAKDTFKYEGCYYEDPYIRGFLRDCFLRPSCHACKFTTIDRCSDFTIADWWGYKKEDKADKNFRKKGVSLLFVNSEKAKSLLGNLNMALRPRTIEEALKTNICLTRSFPMNERRTQFWKDYNLQPFHTLVSKYMYPEKLTFRTNFLQHHVNLDYVYGISNIFNFLDKGISIIRKLTNKIISK